MNDELALRKERIFPNSPTNHLNLFPVSRRNYIVALVSVLGVLGTISPANADRSYTSMQVPNLIFLDIPGMLESH
jgi:hypothetical protein